MDKKNRNGHDISQDNRNALNEMKERGVHVVISTGRSGLQAKKYLDGIDYEYAVTAFA